MAWLVKLVDKGKRKKRTEKQKEKKKMHHQIQREKLLENVDGKAVNLKVKVGLKEEEEDREEEIMGSRREGGTAGESLVEVRRGDRIINMVGSQVLREGCQPGIQVTL